ncbi:MAG: pilin [Nanoarchaeota archaeon]|nr:pilin [Nanoarchaeota archaeon]
MKKIGIIIIAVLMLGTTHAGYAADTEPGPGDTVPGNAGRAGTTPDSIDLNKAKWNPLGPGVTTIEALLKRIINWLITIAAPIAAGMVVYGAYQMLFAAGEPEKVKTGRNTILYTVVGYGIILISWGVVSIVENFLKGG